MTPQERIDEVLQRRWLDCAQREDTLKDDHAIHQFRLACKRLRYAIELFDLARLAESAKALSQLTDELGAAHDCVVLAERARESSAPLVAAQAAAEREQYLTQAIATWQRLAPKLREELG